MRNERNSKVSAVGVLVALVIVVIVAAIIMPAFNRSDRGCRKSPCQSNMKECVLALHSYLNDYDNTLPSSILVSHSKKWNARDFRTFATKAGQLPPKANERPRTWAQILYNHIKSNDIMFCPADPSDHTNPNAETSYWWKLAIDKAWYGEGCKSPCKTEREFAFNFDQIILYEHMGWHCGDTSGLKDGILINAAYMDGHVKTVQLKTAGSKYHQNSLMPAGGEPAWFNFNGDPSNKMPTVPKIGRYCDPRIYCDRL